MLRWHRLTAFFGAILLTYIVVTGLGIELSDMRALVMHAPETDPDMLMMRQHIYGPPNYAVVSAPDYTARALLPGTDYISGLKRAATLGRAAVPGGTLRLVELRTVGATVAAHVQMNDQHLIFDLASGRPLPSSDLPPPQPPRGFSSPRADFKYLHRFNYLGQPATGLNFIAGLILGLLIVTGLWHYSRLLRARWRMNRKALFWKSGGWWRSLHRWVALVASLVVIWLTTTGLLLAADNFGGFIHGATHGRPTGPAAFDGDWSSPLLDANIPAMTNTTLGAFKAVHPDWPIRVLRLRIFAGYPQGVIVAGNPETTQLVFNADTGASMSMHEKGYPDLGFPSGWEWHQRLKRMHRGDIFGMTGRWLETIGGLSLLYLIVSGSIMYGQMLVARRRKGRLEWTW